LVGSERGRASTSRYRAYPLLEQPPFRPDTSLMLLNLQLNKDHAKCAAQQKLNRCLI
jgi:hypothetical protein